MSEQFRVFSRTIPEVEKDLASLHTKMLEKSRHAREVAAKARKSGNRKKWDKFNAVARVWEMAAVELMGVGVPFPWPADGKWLREN